MDCRVKPGNDVEWSRVAPYEPRSLVIVVKAEMASRLE
jgi:hypothetical protein